MDSDLKILIIETDSSVSARLQNGLKEAGFSLFYTAGPQEPMERLAAGAPEVAIVGPSLDKLSCLNTIHKLKIINPRLPVLSACDDGCMSGECVKGVFEGVHSFKPDLDPQKIPELIENALGFKAECESRPLCPAIVGQSQAIRDIRKEIEKVSDKDITVLITGESGTGKDLIARSVHHYSRRNEGPLVKINCGALPDELLESEVFGFQRGAFTGAHRDKPGRLEMASGGTLFIDEIGDLSLGLQVKFLQVLEDKAFSRLGGTRDKIVDVRVVAATNTDLASKMREGAFRQDLFYRLNVVHIKAPTLRDRKDDILLLAHYFINKYCFEFRKPALDLPAKVCEFFESYPWPGNVRELENLIRRAIVLRDWDFIFKELSLDRPYPESENGVLPGEKAPPLKWGEDRLREFFGEGDFSLKKVTKAYVSEAERQTILEALKETDWNRKKAAGLLGVSYKTLLTRIIEFDLKP
jgi:two-component system response regulator AtoC